MPRTYAAYQAELRTAAASRKDPRREARKCLPPHWQRTKHPRCDRIRTQFFGQLTIWPPDRFRR